METCFREFQEWYIICSCVIIHVVSETIEYILWQPSHLVFWDTNTAVQPLLLCIIGVANTFFDIIPRICILVSENFGMYPRISRMMRYLVLRNHSCCQWNNTIRSCDNPHILSFQTTTVNNIHLPNSTPLILIAFSIWVLPRIILLWDLKSSWGLWENFLEWYFIWYCVIIHVVSETIQFILWQFSHLVIWDNGWCGNNILSF